MFRTLSINDQGACDAGSQRDQVVSQRETRPPVPLFRPDRGLEGVAGGEERKPGRPAPGVETSRADLMVPPKTPTNSTAQIQDKMASVEGMINAMKASRSPTKLSSPIKLSYLTKESNTRTFAVFDVDGRLFELDAQFKAMKEVMDVSLTDRKAMEDVIDLAKTRGEYVFFLHCW